MFVRRRPINKPAAVMAIPSVFFLFLAFFGFSSPVQATPITDTFDSLSGWTVTGNPIANGALRFTYDSGSVTKTISVPGAGTLTASIDVDNSQTNCIGSCTPIPDTYAFYLGDAHIDSSTAHGVTTLTQSVVTTGAGDVVLYLAGVDNGFWAGYYGPVMDNLSYEFVPAATSLEVTSLLDDGSSGTLRWAITQANATAGGIYDSITFGVNGTITLASALPQITQNLTVTGNGRTQTVIGGNNLYRPFNIASTKSLTISDMTLQNGQSTNGGLIFNGSGTLSATNVRFTGMGGGSAVFNNNNGSVSTLTDTTFDYLYIGVAGDYGSTPSTLSQTDTDYTNRTYVYDSVFSNNTYGISGQRFVKINNSQFTSNSQAGASLGGLNRQQVTNSSFTSNGTGVYLSSWIPTSWTPGDGNQMVSGNTFNGNTTAIQFSNNWNNGSSVYNGVSANSFSTASGNTFGVTALNTNNFSGSGYVEYNNAITSAYLNAVTNLTAVANSDGSVDLDWDASAASNTAIYGYSVSFYDLTVIGGATSGGWGVWTNQGTNYSLSTGMFSGSNPVTTGYGPVRFGIKAMSGQCVGVGTGSCTYGPEVTVDATVLDPTPVTTTTSSTSSTTTSTTVAPVVVIPPSNTTVPLPQYPEPETESTTVTLPVETGPGIELPTETIPEYSEPVETDPIELGPVETEPETVVIIIPPDDYTFTDIEDNEPITTVILDNILKNTFTTDIEADEVGAVLDTLLGAELTNAQFDNVLEAVFTEDVSADVFTEALTTMLDADITSEQLTAVLDSAFSENTSAENMVAALDSILDGPISSGDLNTVMNAVFDEDISVADIMTVLGDLLKTNLSMSETEAIFDSVFDSDLSDAETIELIVDVLAGELTAELLGAVLGSVFDESVSTEVLIETFTAVLDGELNAESVRVIVDVLESDTITSEQVGQVVTLVIEQEGGIKSGQATELATSAKVLESIDGEQASAVFNAIVVAEVSEEAGAAISEALTEASTDVKESFEEEINVFAGVFDTYTAIGSSIDVGTRRSVIAVNLVTSGLALSSAAGAIPTPGHSAPSAPRQDVAARKEEEAEEGGAIEGEGPDWIKGISIYKYEDGVRVMDWKKFTRKFVYGILTSGFTLAGATVMYFTLSGLTQQIALWGTLLAFTGSMYLHMKEPDEG